MASAIFCIKSDLLFEAVVFRRFRGGRAGLVPAAAGAAVFFFPAAFCDRTRPGFVCGF